MKLFRRDMLQELLRFGAVGGILFSVDFGVLVALQELGPKVCALIQIAILPAILLKYEK